ncbi:MAG: hypothetical protein IKQ22_03955 [Clostridia bacterium]|nr:hypothetical protein [Clostridia bacterium]
MDKEFFRKLCYSFNEDYNGIDIDNIEALAMRNDVSIPDAVDVAKEFLMKKHAIILHRTLKVLGILQITQQVSLILLTI